MPGNSPIAGTGFPDLMVIGDGINDIPMFEAAGFSVAMENSPADLLDVADAVVPNIENDGAAAAIERYVLDRS